MGRRAVALAIFLGVTLAAPAAGAAQPPNDDFESATVLGPLPDQDAVSTGEATSQAGEPQPPCSAGVSRTVWYAYTPGADVVLAADTLGSSFDTVLAVWTGPALGSLDLVACSDDSTFGLVSRAVFRASAGTTYYLQVGGFAGAAGALNVRLREVDAGVIEGTVTEEGTGAPLANICVLALDQDFDTEHFTMTGADGGYELLTRSGSYLVVFFDLCGASDDYRPEFFDDVLLPEEATPVEVTPPSVESGIDAELEPGCPGFASFGLEPHVIGTAGSDTLAGGPGDDVICGLGGADTLRGLGGHDLILGGAGNDALFGGPGDDGILGGAGRDRIRGEGGMDLVFGDAGSDRITGGGGRDDLIGGGGNDVISGGGASDFLFGMGGNDRLFGQGGPDLLSGGRGTDLCSGGPGRDRGLGCERLRSIELEGRRGSPAGGMARAFIETNGEGKLGIPPFALGLKS